MLINDGKRTGLALCEASLLLSIATSASADMPWKIDHHEATKLASEAYNNSLEYTDKFDDINDWPSSPPFYLLSMGDTGTFAVNPWTGDVWDSWGCTK